MNASSGFRLPHLHFVFASLIIFLSSNLLEAENLSRARAFDLTCEHLHNPTGIGVSVPRLSWKIRSDRIGEIQTAYEVRAASSQRELAAGRVDLWDSGKVNSDQSVLVAWAGKALDSRMRVYWQVRIWDKDGASSPWSDPGSFELGLLHSTNEWKGAWITADLPRYDILQSSLAKAAWINAGSTANQAAGVRLVVELPADSSVRSADIDAAADGLLSIYVNGSATRQGSSSRTAPLHADIRSQLKPGSNIIAIASAAVRGAVRRDSGAAGRNAIAAHAMVELQNGRRIEFDTDGSWKAAAAPFGDWYGTNVDDSSWSAATVVAPYSAEPSRYADTTIGPGRYLRKEFDAKKGIARARLYSTALGVYEASINGKFVNRDSVLDPGWTDYRKRVMVQTFDVTPLIQSGRNVIVAALGDGWYAGRLGWMGLAQYGSRPAFNAQLEITYSDGSRDVFFTDETWSGGPGEIVGSDLQWGEIIDARRLSPVETAARSNWTSVIVESHDVALVPQAGPAIRQLLDLRPETITRRGDAWIIDFGQNMVGHVRLSATGPSGTTIRVRHAEILNRDGSIYTENLRPALATDTFILKGGNRETFEPHFTFHGFRYAEITGYPGELKRDNVRGVVVGSDTPRTGAWESSDTNLNRLYENIVWSQRGNFLSVPTDCPQRDERMGWMGDAQVFAPTAARNADVSAFFTKWMADVNDGQGANGDYSDVSPRVARPQPGWPVWGDAGVIIPWAMFEAYGDDAFLAANYPCMARWVDFNVKRSSNLILNGGVGDHLAPRRTPTELVDTAYFANSARIVAAAAALLGKNEDAGKYSKLHHDIVEAFDRAFVSTNGSLRGDTQTAYILALQFGLLPEEMRSAAAQRLADNVAQSGHLTTGFVGVGLICPTLTRIGRSDLAWQLLLTDTYPSWLFSVKNGATTIWERWDGWTPERGFQDSAMNSFNHYSLGSVGAWLYSGAGGIQIDAAHPGYKHFFLRPQFSRRVSYVKATQESPYGPISSHWRAEKDEMVYDVAVPPNTSAELELPVPAGSIRESGKPLASSADPARVSLVAGKYRFTFPLSAIADEKAVTRGAGL